MVPRGLIVILAMAIGLALPMSGLALARGEKEAPQAVFARDEDATPLMAADDDDDDDGDDDDDNSNDGNTDRTGKSNDRTNSRFTGVSRDRDWSRGDLTRDKTHDGKGGKKRDWSRHHTNDRSRNDTR